MADEVILEGVSLEEVKVYDLDAIHNYSPLGGVSLEEVKEYDLEPIRNRSYLMAISFEEVYLTPDIQVGKPIYT